MKSAPLVGITGTGLVSSLGKSAEETFDAMLAGRVGVGTMNALEQKADPDRGGGQAIDLEDGLEWSGSRAGLYLRAVVMDALSKVNHAGTDTHRIAAVFGSTLHGMRAGGEYLRSGDPEHLKHYLASSVLDEALEGLGFGPIRLTTCAACSSGLSSVGLGITLLRSRVADIVVVGGYDTVSEYAYAGFDSLRLVSDSSLRPFASNRNGMKVGEGYAALVLERVEDAQMRGNEVFAIVAGYGESSDSFHLTKPDPEGAGAATAIQDAIQEAGLQAGSISMISAHATGTRNNDAGEYQALSRVFGTHLPSIPVVGFKACLGHTLGGAGAVELVLSLEAIKRSIVPPTPSAGQTDPAFEWLRLVSGDPVEASIAATLNISLGFGGANTGVVLRDPRGFAVSKKSAKTPDDAVITGVGLVLPGAIGVDSFADLLSSREPTISGPIPFDQYKHLFNARRARRISEFSKLNLAAAACALDHSQLDTRCGPACSVILGTAHGATQYCEDYYGEIVRDGLGAANPVLFAEGVPNAAAAHLSMMLGLKGGCQSIIGSKCAGLEALLLAALRIQEGRWSRCLVGAAEEYSEVVNEAHKVCRSLVSSHVGSGAATIVVESRREAESRGATIYGVIGKGWWQDRCSPDLDEGFVRTLGSPTRVRLDMGAGGKTEGQKRDGLHTIRSNFPEMYSVNALVGICAGLLESVGDFTVFSEDFTGRMCALPVASTGLMSGNA